MGEAALTATSGSAALAWMLASLVRASPLLLRRVIAKAALQRVAVEWAIARSPSQSRESPEPMDTCDSPRFLVRVDDFPAHDLETSVFTDFHEVLSTRGIPYLLGVTPRLAIAPLDARADALRGVRDADVAVLRRICADGVDLALHGFTHRMRAPHVRSELAGMPEAELRRSLDQAFQMFEEWELPKPLAFIPPFNAIDRCAARVMSEYMPLLCGGPESIYCLGFHKCPDVVEGMEYWPSYYPAYGRAHKLASYVRHVSRRGRRWLIPLTVHWRWEKEDEFQGVMELAETLSGKVLRWSALAVFRRTAILTPPIARDAYRREHGSRQGTRE